MALSPDDARTYGRIGGLTYAATTPPHELSRRASRAQAGLLARFEREADPEGELLPAERRRRAKLRYRAHMTRLSRKAAQRRKALPVVPSPGPQHPASSGSASRTR